MRSLDKQHLEDAQAQYQQLCAQYLEMMPGVDIDDVVYRAIINHGIFGNVEGIPFERFSVFTKLKGIEAALNDLLQP